MKRQSLELSDIQGLFRGYGRPLPCGEFLLLSVDGDTTTQATTFRRFIEHLEPLVTSSRTWRHAAPSAATNLAFTWEGLKALHLPVPVLDSFPTEFKEGMKSRSRRLGDTGDNDPENWEDLWTGRPVHAWIGVYGGTRAAVEGRVVEIEEILSGAGGHPSWIRGRQRVQQLLDADDEIIEHFGFRDGISNPPIEGLPRPDDPDDHSGGKLDERGSWHPIAAGEFLLGDYSDEVTEKPPAPVAPVLARNGTFLVYRKLRQHVRRFRAYVEERARAGPIDDPERIAAKMVGRYRSGMPLIGAGASNPLNDFRYDDDPGGERCPLGAHIRRTNPRDTLSHGRDGSLNFRTLLVDRHRIIRRGIPYGDYLDDQHRGPPPRSDRADAAAYGGGPDDERGLIFLSLQASIARQFEFLQQQWIQHGDRLEQGNDRDPIAGNNAGRGRMVIPGRPTVVCPDLPSFVTLRGGDYFFLPGLRAIRYLTEGSW